MLQMLQFVPSLLKTEMLPCNYRIVSFACSNALHFQSFVSDFAQHFTVLNLGHTLIDV